MKLKLSKQCLFLVPTKRNFSSSYDYYFDYFKGFIKGCVQEKDIIAFDVKRTKTPKSWTFCDPWDWVVQRGDL